jgi:predicted metal-dependent peptidase
MTEELDYQVLDKEMDRVKTKVFLGSNAAFLGPLMCSVNFLWTEDIRTAQTNGISLYWNPHWFLKLPFDTRITVLLHELWHIALLHMIRRGSRDPEIWNYACDININNMLKAQGYSFAGTSPWIDASYGEQPTEEIYDSLYSMPDLSVLGNYVWGSEGWDEEGDKGDIIEPEEGEGDVAEHTIINKVVQASTAAKMSGAGDDGVPSEIETMLKRFLQPKLPWELLLRQFFQALTGQDYSWSRPNRRYRDMYLPSLMEDESGLEHLIYYLDVSGSVSDGEVVRFNSEVKFIKETFNPHRLTLVLFDDQIQREYDFYEDDPFEEIVIVGRGGTDLGPVREHMLKHRPTAAVVFSDMCCAPMQPLPPGIDIPTIWVGVNAGNETQVHFGKLVHIKE